jgi:hypothetical protein
MTGDKTIQVQPSDVQSEAQTAAGAVAQAAQPGPVPVPGAGSPIDEAAAGVAGAVAKNVAESSAKLAPESAAILAHAEEALAKMQGQEARNAENVSAVPAGLTQQEALSPGAPAATPGAAESIPSSMMGAAGMTGRSFRADGTTSDVR